MHKYADSSMSDNLKYAGKDWRQEERGSERMRWLSGITDSTDMSFSKVWETVKNRGVWRAVVHGVSNSQTQQSD